MIVISDVLWNTLSTFVLCYNILLTFTCIYIVGSRLVFMNLQVFYQSKVISKLEYAFQSLVHITLDLFFFLFCFIHFTFLKLNHVPDV